MYKLYFPHETSFAFPLSPSSLVYSDELPPILLEMTPHLKSSWF